MRNSYIILYTHRLVLDDPAELHHDEAGGVGPAHGRQLLGAAGVEGVHRHLECHAGARLQTLLVSCNPSEVFNPPCDPY